MEKCIAQVLKQHMLHIYQQSLFEENLIGF